ncbi:hypothetical protein F4808DRAFT_475596 [Astrocystis sublimbata]|nr:hypothetical protein F4808DRAFT_475596 [Astrocystis sublimbata]
MCLFSEISPPEPDKPIMIKIPLHFEDLWVTCTALEPYVQDESCNKIDNAVQINILPIFKEIERSVMTSDPGTSELNVDQRLAKHIIAHLFRQQKQIPGRIKNSANIYLTVPEDVVATRDCLQVLRVLLSTLIRWIVDCVTFITYEEMKNAREAACAIAYQEIARLEQGSPQNDAPGILLVPGSREATLMDVITLLKLLSALRHCAFTTSAEEEWIFIVFVDRIMRFEGFRDARYLGCFRKCLRNTMVERLGAHVIYIEDLPDEDKGK